ncbi:MAG: OmpH family outer membrane protein [Candidatus Hydrogenedentes bacterium]|nr:OmpH family outer membrane protein [Candidatus Hydrogenedentota bacterium]
MRIFFTVRVLFYVLVLACLCLNGYPQDSQKSGEGGVSYRIAVVDVDLLMREYNKRKEKYEELQKEVDAQQKELDNMMARIEADRKKLEDGKATMSDQEKLDLRMKIEQEAAAYRAELEKKQKTIDSKEERIIRECLDDIQNAISVIATTENYHLVFNAGKSLKSALIYHSPTIDITSKVLATLNSGSASGSTSSKR